MECPSSPEVVILTGTGDKKGAELAYNYGAWDFLQKPFLRKEVSLSVSRALQYRTEKKASEKPRVLWREGIIGDSPPIRSCLESVAQAAGSKASVLITGETGTGKELFAQAIHNNSKDSSGNFVVVDCAAIPKDLVESTLFGHERGAFTGADKAREGLIKQADGGTLFLDEVGELPLAIQKSFLRVLQENRFRSVGKNEEIKSNFRLVSATNRDLEIMVEEGTFRNDLLFRLRSLTIQLPPLKQRLDDMKSLIINFIQQNEIQDMEIKGFTPEFLEALKGYDWPGNIRELAHTVEYALSASSGSLNLYPKHLPPYIRVQQIGDFPDKGESEAEGKTDLTTLEELPQLREFRDSVIESIEKDYLHELMKRTRGKIKLACEISGLSASRLQALLKKYDTPRFRSS